MFIEKKCQLDDDKLKNVSVDLKKVKWCCRKRSWLKNCIWRISSESSCNSDYPY